MRSLYPKNPPNKGAKQTKADLLALNTGRSDEDGGGSGGGVATGRRDGRKKREAAAAAEMAVRGEKRRNDYVS